MATSPFAVITREKRFVWIGLAAYFILSFLIALFSSGTYDAGDSIMHYQIAHYAFQHPENLLSHWGKPFFTLVAVPFAAMGFWGIQLFQCLLAVGTGWMVYRCARILRFKWAWLAPLLVLAAPEFFLSQLSGLTEPFFAFMLVLGVLLLLRGDSVWGAIVLSFLPFVRTEGFLVLPAFALYLVTQREWKAIPLLAAGTVLYTLLGGIFLGDFGWIWNQNPYANKTQTYGVGEWLHFPKQYLFVVGIPIYALTVLGWVMVVIRVAMRSIRRPLEELCLVWGPFAIYFGAHIYFWVSGVGHSMGLIRVMIAILPLGALIALSGLQFLDWFHAKWRPFQRVLISLVAVYVVAFPLIPNPSALHAKEFTATVDQRMLQEVAHYMEIKGLQDRKLYTVHPSAAYFLGIDPFDPQRYRSLNRLQDDQVAPGYLILLDTWFGQVESGYSPEYFDAQPAQYKRLHSWSGTDGNTPIGLYLYEKI